MIDFNLQNLKKKKMFYFYIGAAQNLALRAVARFAHLFIRAGRSSVGNIKEPQRRLLRSYDFFI